MLKPWRYQHEHNTTSDQLHKLSTLIRPNKQENQIYTHNQQLHFLSIQFNCSDFLYKRRGHLHISMSGTLPSDCGNMKIRTNSELNDTKKLRIIFKSHQVLDK